MGLAVAVSDGVVTGSVRQEAAHHRAHRENESAGEKLRAHGLAVRQVGRGNDGVDRSVRRFHRRDGIVEKSSSGFSSEMSGLATSEIWLPQWARAVVVPSVNSNSPTWRRTFFLVQ